MITKFMRCDKWLHDALNGISHEIVWMDGWLAQHMLQGLPVDGGTPPSAQPAWLLPAHPNPEPLFPNIEHLVPGEAVFLQGLDSRLAARAYQVNRALASRHICFQLRALSVNLRDTDKFDRYLWNVILQMTWKPTQLQLISITFHYVKHIRYSPLRSVVLNIFPVFKAISRCMCLTHAQIDGMILNQRSAEAGN